MNGALKKELIWLRKSWILHLILFIFTGAVGLAATPAVLMLPVFLSLIMYVNLAVDEASGWERLNAATPNDRTAYMNAKFIMVCIAVTVSMVTAAICCTATQFVFSGLSENIFAVWATIPLCLPAGMLMPSIMFPIWAKLGYKKSSIFFAAICLTPALTLPVFGERLGNRLDEMEDQGILTMKNVTQAINFITPIAVLITVILTAVSWVLTVKLYKKKDL